MIAGLRPLAHPLTEPGGLPVPPALAALYAAALLFVIVYAVAPSRARLPERDEAPLDPWSGRLTGWNWAGRVVALAVLGGAIVAARLGSENELENIVPALVLGAGWPLMVLACALGASWRWFDPLDGAARLVDRSGVAQPFADVAWAALAAALVGWYMAVPVGALTPRMLGAALAIYVLAMAAGALYFGRSWLGRADVFGLFLSWLSRLGRKRLVSWIPPLNADLMLGVLSGGLVFGAVRRSALWGELNSSPQATLYATVGFVFSCAVAGAIVTGGERWARRSDSAGAVTAAMVPAVASIAIALALARNRMLVSIQLLPSLASDPLGRGWDLFGTAGGAIDPNPLGTTGLAVVQVAVLLVGHMAGAYVFARRSSRRSRPSGALVLSINLAVSVMAVSAVSALPTGA